MVRFIEPGGATSFATGRGEYNNNNSYRQHHRHRHYRLHSLRAGSHVRALSLSLSRYRLARALLVRE